MRLNENVTYNNYERKGLYRDTLGVHKGKSSEALSHEPPPPPAIENKNKTHKAQQQVPKTKTKNLQCSILKPESASWKFTKQPCKLLQHVLLFKCPGSWNPADGVPSLLLLEKEWFTFYFYKQPHPPEPKLISVANFRTFPLQWPSPLPNAWKHSHVPPLHQPLICEYPLFAL